MKSETIPPRSQTTAESEASTTEVPEAGPDGSTTPELPLDVVFDLLSNQRRRRVLRFLLSEPETTLGDLAEHVAAIENDKPERALSSTERKRVYICLYQCHLPKMDDAGVIDFDENRKTVVLGEHAEHVTRFLPPDDEVSTGTNREFNWQSTVEMIARSLPGFR